MRTDFARYGNTGADHSQPCCNHPGSGHSRSAAGRDQARTYAFERYDARAKLNVSVRRGGQLLALRAVSSDAP